MVTSVALENIAYQYYIVYAITGLTFFGSIDFLHPEIREVGGLVSARFVHSGGRQDGEPLSQYALGRADYGR